MAAFRDESNVLGDDARIQFIGVWNDYLRWSSAVSAVASNGKATIAFIGNVKSGKTMAQKALIGSGAVPSTNVPATAGVVACQHRSTATHADSELYLLDSVDGLCTRPLPSKSPIAKGISAISCELQRINHANRNSKVCVVCGMCCGHAGTFAPYVI